MNIWSHKARVTAFRTLLLYVFIEFHLYLRMHTVEMVFSYAKERQGTTFSTFLQLYNIRSRILRLPT